MLIFSALATISMQVTGNCVPTIIPFYDFCITYNNLIYIFFFSFVADFWLKFFVIFAGSQILKDNIMPICDLIIFENNLFEYYQNGGEINSLFTNI